MVDLLGRKASELRLLVLCRSRDFVLLLLEERIGVMRNHQVLQLGLLI